MSKKIESLTDDQKAQFAPWVEKWTAIGLSCEPADRERAEKGIRAHYEVAKLLQPEVIAWVESPMLVSIAGPLAALSVSKGVSTADAVSSAVARARAIVATGAAKASEIEAIKSNWSSYLGGSFWAAFPAWATFFRDVLGVDVPVGPREDTDSACGWWWPHTQFTIVSDRPQSLHRDGEGRLHSQTAAAISWRDGWSCYYWHGVRVPKEWILTPDSVERSLVLTNQNIEQRRCLAEILGWASVLDQVQTKIIDENSNPSIGTLLECVVEGEPARFLRVKCGTGRDFVLSVPIEMRTALQANACSYDVTEEDILGLELRT